MPIRTITFVTIGNTSEVKGAGDWEQGLSTLGENQALARRVSFSGRGLDLAPPHFDLVLSPLAIPAIETAEIISGWDPDSIVKVPELSTAEGEVGKILEAMFDRLGRKPLEIYLQGTVKEIRCLRNFGAAGWHNLMTPVFGSAKAKSVLAVGRAVYCPLIGFHADTRVCKKLLTSNMTECGAFQIILQDGEVTKCKILPDMEVATTA